MEHDPRDPVGLLRDEILQLRTSGFDVVGLEARAAEIIEGRRADQAAKMLDVADTMSRRPDWPYVEPHDERLILASLPADPGLTAPTPDDQFLTRLHGAWLGRCAGCTLGKPIEGWMPIAVRRYLETIDAWPPTDYLRRLEPMPTWAPPMKPAWRVSTRGSISGTPRDDDIDYTILGLHVHEEHGVDPPLDRLADELLDHLPFGQVFTAERVAYRNLVSGIAPSEAGGYRNPYREWVGAMIRADIHGLVAPGRPRAAAAHALRDALLTHRGNGVYGAMWVAAALSAATAGADARQVVEVGLKNVPSGSRSAEAVRWLLALVDSEADWVVVRDQLHTRYGRYPWVHALPNLSAIVAALLWGEGDFGRSIGIAVAMGLDTDSDAATVGSLIGAIVGAPAISASWVQPLEDRIDSSVRGFAGVRISDVTLRTGRLAADYAASGR